MAYCTADDIKKRIPEARLIELTDDTQTETIDADNISAAIEAADDEIDSWCQGRYDTPFSPVPGIIKTMSINIAIYNLFARQQITDDAVEKRYDNAIKILQNVAMGKIEIGLSSGSNEPETKIDISSNTRVFGDTFRTEF